MVIPQVAKVLRPLEAGDIGDESTAVLFTTGPTGKPGGSVVFRVQNVMLFVNGSGPSIQAGDLVPLARRVAERALRA